MNRIGQNIRQESLSPVSVKALEKISLFKKTGNLVLYKKSERICAATFAVSDSINSDSLRERVRAEALNVFSGVRDAIARRGSVTPSDADVLALGAISLASVLELACRAGEITESNYLLMRQECSRLAEVIVETASRAEGSLDRSIFDTGVREEEGDVGRPALSAPRQNPRLARSQADSFKGHVKDTKKDSGNLVSFKGSARDFVANLSYSIEDREMKIIEVVKSKEKVSIKDIVETMPDVGEKTVQRALISLVSRGVLKKEGERRWSRYAMAQATLAV